MTILYFSLVIIGLILMLSSFALKSSISFREIFKKDNLKDTVVEFLKSLGISAIIAFVSILIFNINADSRHSELTNQINEFSWEKKLSHYEPDRQIVQKVFLEEDFRWEDLKISAQIEMSKDFEKSKRCLYQYTLDYDVKNISSEEKNYDVSHKITSIFNEGDENICDITDVVITLSDGSKELCEVNDCVIQDTTNGFWNMNLNIANRIKIPPGKSIHVVGTFSYLDPINNGYQVFGLKKPTKGITYEITYNPSLFNTEIVPWPEGGDEDIYDTLKPKPLIGKDRLTTFSWKSNDYFLPWQSVILVYDKK